MQASQLNLKTAEVITFSTVAVVGEQLQLVTVKAVTDNYPLRGQLSNSKQINQTANLKIGIPASGTVWVDSKLLNLMAIKQADRITLRVAQFVVSATLLDEPDVSSNWLNIARQVFIR